MVTRAPSIPALAPRVLWLAIPLLLLTWWTRVAGIDQFPFFIDEGLHVYFSEVTMQTHPVIYANKYYLFSIWWWGIFAPHAAEPIWLSRVVTVLAILPGVAAVIAIGRLFGGWWGALFGGLFYLLSTYHYFFDRLAMADPISASAALVGICFAARLARRVDWRDAALCGLCVFLAIGFKLSALPYLGVPVAAALALSPRSATWRARARWLGVALVVELGLLAVFTGTLIVARRNPFANAGDHVGIGEGGALDFLNRIPGSAAYMLENLSGFVGTGGLLLLAVMLLLLLVRRRFFLLLVLLAPTLVFLTSAMQTSRYYAAPMLVVLTCGAVALADVMRERFGRILAVSGLLVWGALAWLPFAWAMNTAPLDTPLPPRDRREYIAADSSGFGLRETRDTLEARGAGTVIGVLANCQSLRYEAFNRFPVECPQINPDGRSIPELEALLQERRAEGVYAVLEALTYLPAAAPGEAAETIEDVSGRPRLTIYDLAP